VHRISAATTFTYTPLGQLASLTDAENQTTSYTYDARGLKLTETYPDHTGGSTVGQTGYGIVTFVYDNAGRVLRKQDQLGVTLTHSYDLAGRMTRRDYRTAANSPSGTIADSDTFTFDRASRMRTAVNGRYTNTVTYTFDPVGRKATEALTISARTYTTRQAYNARNELTTITYPDNTTSTRSYHATGALNQLRLDNATVSTRSYDVGRRQTSEALGNGITETRTYRADNLLSAINYSNTSLGNMTYTWDANKNKTSESIAGVMSGYGFTAAGTTYDFEDRLTGFSRAATSGPALLSQSWNLTTVGDWTSVTTNGTAQNRTHGPTHELLTAGGQNVATDVKGNITTLPANLRPAGATTALNLTWDSDNKLRSADIDANGTADVNFQYDALGRRCARSGTGGSVVYVQMDQQTIADYPVGGAATTPTFRYVYASYIDEPVVRKTAGTGGTLVYFHRNHQYSVTAITTSTGAIAERYAYTAYGQPTILNASGTVISATTLSNRYTYTGREWDSTVGLYDFRVRTLCARVGTFLGRDPVGYVDGDSLYRVYFGMSGVDPYGLHCKPRINSGAGYEFELNHGNLSTSGWGTAFAYNVAIRGRNQFRKNAIDSSATFEAEGHGYVEAWWRVFDYVHLRWRNVTLGIAGNKANANAECKVSCSECCDIMITCEGAPWTGTHQAYDDKDLKSLMGFLYGNLVRPGKAIAAIGWHIMLNRTIGSVTAVSSGGYSAEDPVITVGIGGGGTGIQGGVTLTFPPTGTKLPEKFTTGYNIVWECVKP
jgi:RHS repeat-associated protein